MELDIKDLDALKIAAQELGLEFVENQKTYKWYGRSVGDYALPAGFRADELGKCEHALRVKGNPNAYEIGVVKRRDGRPGYTLLWDFWNRGYGMQDKVGTNGDRLKQEYSAQLGIKHWRKRGFRVTTTRDENNYVTVKATR